MGQIGTHERDLEVGVKHIDVLRVAMNLAFDAGKLHQCAEETRDSLLRDEFMRRADGIMGEAWDKLTFLDGEIGDSARAERERCYPRNNDPVKPYHLMSFRKALRTKVLEIDHRDHHDGLVPIGKLRKALSHLGLNRATFDAALLEEERAYTIDLKIFNNPKRAKDPHEGIGMEGRGLLYFVVLR